MIDKRVFFAVTGALLFLLWQTASQANTATVDLYYCQTTEASQ